VTTTGEALATTCATRHCPEHGCQKCAACARWNRRKRRRSHKRRPRKT